MEPPQYPRQASAITTRRLSGPAILTRPALRFLPTIGYTTGMRTDSHIVLAASSGASLVLILVGVVVVVGLLAMFVAGRRRAARRARSSTPAPGTRPPGGEAQRGETWQTPDDDPDQGNPHP